MFKTLTLVPQGNQDQTGHWSRVKRLVVGEFGPDGFGLLGRARQMRRESELDLKTEEELSEFLLALELLVRPEQRDALERVLVQLGRSA